MQRELGSTVMDLPHEFKPDTAQRDSECRCGRPKFDPLHDQRITERADYSGPLFETEKGV